MIEVLVDVCDTGSDGEPMKWLWGWMEDRSQRKTIVCVFGIARYRARSCSIEFGFLNLPIPVEEVLVSPPCNNTQHDYAPDAPICIHNQSPRPWRSHQPGDDSDP